MEPDEKTLEQLEAELGLVPEEQAALKEFANLTEEFEEPAQETPSTSEEDRLAGPLSMIPVQDARSTGHKNLVVKRGPGRPRKVERAPQVTDLEYHVAMTEARQKYMASDPLLVAIENKVDPVDILYQVKRGVAIEAASMAFDQIEGQKRGKDTSQMSSRRIEALKKIAEIELKLRELEAESLNFTSERFQKVFHFWVRRLATVAQETLPPEMQDLFMNNFARAMENWEEEAAEVANSSSKR